MKIVTIGGGTGGSIVDEALSKAYPALTSVVTSFDNGGSSGILRKEFGSLPHGDIRRRIFAQKTIQNKILEELYNFRFEKDNSLETHSMGNLLLLAATKLWGEKEGIQKVCELFKIKGKVLPITFDYAELAARLTNGKTIIGEEIIGQHVIDKKTDVRKIDRVYLTRETKINKEVALEIQQANYIILCPGDFYGSLTSNFLVGGFKESILRSKAKIIYFPNIMTKAAETNGFKLSNFVSILEKYLGKRIDYIVYNSKKPSKRLLDKYKNEEMAELVENDLLLDRRILEVPLLKENGAIRHDTKLILASFKKIIKLSKIKRKKLYIFDLDDTIIGTTPYVEEFLKRDFKNLLLYPMTEEMLKGIKKENCILLTYDENGLQNEKITKLNIKKFFSKIHIVKKVEDKHKLIVKIAKENSNRDIIVVGDRHDAELQAAKLLGLKTVCVAFKENKNTNKDMHHVYDYVVEEVKDFLHFVKVI